MLFCYVPKTVHGKVDFSKELYYNDLTRLKITKSAKICGNFEPCCFIIKVVQIKTKKMSNSAKTNLADC